MDTQFKANYTAPFEQIFDCDISVETNDQQIENIAYETGYCSRGIAQALINTDIKIGSIYAEKYNYECSAASSLAYVLCIEELMDFEPSTRCKMIRIVFLELNKISCYLKNLICIAKDLGAHSLYHRGMFVREKLLDVFENYSGSRLLFGAVKLGGVYDDISDGIIFNIEKTLNDVSDFIDEYTKVFLNNSLTKRRLQDLAQLDSAFFDQKKIYGINSRASGVVLDSRTTESKLGYNEILPSQLQFQGSGDVYARLIVRIKEVDLSKYYIKNAIGNLPQNKLEQINLSDRVLKKGSASISIESYNGIFSLGVISNGTNILDKVEYEAPSKQLLNVLPSVARNLFIEDLVLLHHSFDFFVPEIDG